MDNFLNIDYERNLRLKLKNLKQTDSFEKYSQEFTLLGSKMNLDQLSDQDRLNYFLDGLRSKTRLQLDLIQVENFKDALAAATRVKRTLEESRKDNKVNVSFARIERRGKPWSFKNTNSKIVCYKCKKEGHKSIDCRVKLSNETIKNDNSYCFKCKKSGHKTMECRSAIKTK